MEAGAFFDAVEADERFFGIDFERHDDPAKDVVVLGDGLQTGVIVRMPFWQVLSNEWHNLRLAMMGEEALEHVTRIVGYFSRVENWNQSKLSELADRHRGNYGVPG